MDDDLERRVSRYLEERLAASPQEIGALRRFAATLDQRRTRPFPGIALLAGAAVLLLALVVPMGLRLFSVSSPPGGLGPTIIGPSPSTESLLVLARTYSGMFTAEDQRTGRAEPQIAVFSDGLLVARDPLELRVAENHYRALRLTSAELSALTDTLISSGLADSIAPQAGRGCFDGSTAIFTLGDPGNRATEVVAPCLYDRPDLGITPRPEVFGAGLIRINHLLDDLTARAMASGSAWIGELPSIRLAPYIGG